MTTNNSTRVKPLLFVLETLILPISPIFALFAQPIKKTISRRAGFVDAVSPNRLSCRVKALFSSGLSHIIRSAEPQSSDVATFCEIFRFDANGPLKIAASNLNVIIPRRLETATGGGAPFLRQSIAQTALKKERDVFAVPLLVFPNAVALLRRDYSACSATSTTSSPPPAETVAVNGVAS